MLSARREALVNRVYRAIAVAGSFATAGWIASAVGSSPDRLQCPVEPGDPAVSFVAQALDGIVCLGRDGAIEYVLPCAPYCSEADGAVSRTWALRKKMEIVNSDSTMADHCGASDGITLELLDRGRNAEQLFTVYPPSSPEQIKMAVEGADELDVAPDGQLIVRTPRGDLRFSAPVAWQEVGDGRTVVPVRYTVDALSYGFDVGAYDRTCPLFIDPMLTSTFLGGAGDDRITAIARDPAGNIYVAGTTGSTNFPVTPGAFGTNYAGGGSDVFVAMLDANLGLLKRSTLLGGIWREDVYGMAIDQATNIFIVGVTASSNFPTTANAYDTNCASCTEEVEDFGGGFIFTNYIQDIFVAKFSSDLSTLLASTFLGGTNDDYGPLLAVDGNGRVYVAGNAAEDFPAPAAGAYDNVFNEGELFIASLDNGLSNLTASTFLGGDSDPSAYAFLAVHSNLYIAGSAEPGFPATAGAFSTSYGGGYSDGFVANLHLSLSNLVAATYLGGEEYETVAGLAAGGNGAVYVTGNTESTNFPTTAGAYQPDVEGLSPFQAVTFVARLEASLSNVTASTYFGDPPLLESTLAGFGVGVAPAGDVYFISSVFVITSGPFTNESVYLPFTAGAYDTNVVPDQDASVILLARMDGGLSNVLAATNLGSEDGDYAFNDMYEIAYGPVFDGLGNVYVAGSVEHTNFPVTTGAYDTSYDITVLDTNSFDELQLNDESFVSKLDRTMTRDLEITALAPGGGGFTMAWPSATNVTYDVFRTTNLLGGVVTSLASNIVGTPPFNSYTGSVSGAGSAGFHWISVK